jgi:hypothetical protein
LSWPIIRHYRIFQEDLRTTTKHFGITGLQAKIRSQEALDAEAEDLEGNVYDSLRPCTNISGGTEEKIQFSENSRCFGPGTSLWLPTAKEHFLVWRNGVVVRGEVDLHADLFRKSGNISCTV